MLTDSLIFFRLLNLRGSTERYVSLRSASARWRAISAAVLKKFNTCQSENTALPLSHFSSAAGAFAERHTVAFSQSSLIHLVGPSDCTLHNYVHGGESFFPALSCVPGAYGSFSRLLKDDPRGSDAAH